MLMKRDRVRVAVYATVKTKGKVARAPPNRQILPLLQGLVYTARHFQKSLYAQRN